MRSRVFDFVPRACDARCADLSRWFGQVRVLRLTCVDTLEEDILARAINKKVPIHPDRPTLPQVKCRKLPCWCRAVSGARGSCDRRGDVQREVNRSVGYEGCATATTDELRGSRDLGIDCYPVPVQLCLTWSVHGTSGGPP
eukprot:2382758-Rhodomonas_salina.8